VKGSCCSAADGQTLTDAQWYRPKGSGATLSAFGTRKFGHARRQRRGDEVRALRELRRQSPNSGFVFASERGGPFTPDAINRLIKRIGVRAGFAFPVHAHMLKHACGYALANAGHDTRRIQDWLVHRSIQHTTRYAQLSATPLKDFWR
jgi:integrase